MQPSKCLGNDKRQSHLTAYSQYVISPYGSLIGSYSVVAQYIEDVAQQDQGAGSQSVQILGVRHLQGFS